MKESKMPRCVVWDELPWDEFHPQVSRKVLMGQNMMIVMYKFKKGLTWPMERHESEQGGYILKGKVEFRSGETVTILGQGDSYLIESNAPHESHYIEETILLDIFSPPRKNLMEKGKGFAPDQCEK